MWRRDRTAIFKKRSNIIVTYALATRRTLHSGDAIGTTVYIAAPIVSPYYEIENHCKISLDLSIPLRKLQPTIYVGIKFQAVVCS